MSKHVYESNLGGGWLMTHDIVALIQESWDAAGGDPAKMMLAMHPATLAEYLGIRGERNEIVDAVVPYLAESVPKGTIYLIQADAVPASWDDAPGKIYNFDLTYYDSRPETRAHISRVNQLIGRGMGEMDVRGIRHDRTKLTYPEVSAFDRGTPALKGLTYGSDEYKAAFATYGMKEAIEHHYQHNDHHPEYFAYPRDEHGQVTGPKNKGELLDGTAVSRMDLFQVLEMVCDWVAACERHADCDHARSVAVNTERFGLSPQLADIISNTIEKLKGGGSSDGR